MQKDLQTAVPQPAMWRWGTIQKALPALLKRKRMLQTTWDSQKFSGSGEGRPREDEGETADDPAKEEGFQPDVVTFAVRSEAWWLYTSMLATLNKFPADLTAWSEGCACHPWLMQGQERKDGDLPSQEQQVCEAIDAFYLQQKHRCWDSLPWKFAALNSGDFAARKMAKTILETFDSKIAMGATSADLHHRLTLKLLGVGSPGRAELIQFIDGAMLNTLPELSFFVWSLRFVPIVERIQEREHAVTKRHATHRGKISAPFISCRLRAEELRAVLDVPRDLETFLSLWDNVSNPDGLAKRFGFWRRPLWQTAVCNKYVQSLKFQLAASILYAVDPGTQFAKVVASRKKRQKIKADKETRVSAALQKFQGASAKKWNMVNIERMAAAKHLQDRLRMGSLCSLSHHLLGFVGLAEYLQDALSKTLARQVAHSSLSLQRQSSLCLCSLKLTLNLNCPKFLQACPSQSVRLLLQKWQMRSSQVHSLSL